MPLNCSFVLSRVLGTLLLLVPLVLPPGALGWRMLLSHPRSPELWDTATEGGGGLRAAGVVAPLLCP